ncbi:hypothetical protein [Mucilaginibacter sp.]
MKKIIIIAAIITTAGLTTYCVNAKQNKTNSDTTLKVNKADFAVKSVDVAKSGLGTAD